MRVMVDTNVILSAILKANPTPATVLKDICDHHELVLCETILQECIQVARKRFVEKLSDLELLLASLPFELVHSSMEIKIPIRDIKDQPILNAACHNEIDVFVTGDNHFLELIITRPEIINPTRYKEKYIMGPD